MLLKSSAAFILVVLFMLMLFGAYLYTDCHNEYRGIADVLLVTGWLCHVFLVATQWADDPSDYKPVGVCFRWGSPW